MKTFKQYITEIVSWENNTLFAMGPDNKIKLHHDSTSSMIEHPDAFTELNFNDRPSSDEYNRGIKDLSKSNINRPKAIAWGRIDNDNKTIHIVTQHGLSPYGYGKNENNEKLKREDIFNRIDILKQIKQKYPNFNIQHGYEGGWESPRIPVFTNYSTYEKELTDMLKD